MPKIRKTTQKFNPEDLLIQNEGLIATEENIKEDLHNYVTRGSWPIINEEITPCFPKGEDHRVNLNIPVWAYQFDAVDRHVRRLDIQKSKWIRFWIFYGLQYEQEHFFKENQKIKLK